MADGRKPENPPLFADRLYMDTPFHSTDITLRDLFAAFALNGLRAHDEEGVYPASFLAEESYRIADAMLKERERT